MQVTAAKPTSGSMTATFGVLLSLYPKRSLCCCIGQNSLDAICGVKKGKGFGNQEEDRMGICFFFLGPRLPASHLLEKRGWPSPSGGGPVEPGCPLNLKIDPPNNNPPQKISPNSPRPPHQGTDFGPRSNIPPSEPHIFLQTCN